jgi:hypothetical protein
VHLISIGAFGESLVSFMAFQFAIMFCSGLVGPNFNAMAMEPMGAIAGTASSVQGTITTLGATVVGILVGQSFNGTVIPVVIGFFLCGLGSGHWSLSAAGCSGRTTSSPIRFSSPSTPARSRSGVRSSRPRTAATASG